MVDVVIKSHIWIIIMANFEIIYFSTSPPDFVLDGFLNESDPLQNIGDVVDPSLLNFQLQGSLVQVHW